MDVQSFDEQGFLSDYVFTHRERVLESHSREFAECGTLSAEAQNLIVTTGVSPSDAPLACSFLFAERVVRTCQAAIRLCELGLVQEAQVLSRTAIEALFNSSALLVNPSVIDDIQSNDDYESLKFATSVLKDFPASQITSEDELYLREMASRAGGKPFSVYDSARVSGMLGLYAVQYRFLSGVAGHATFRSLDRSFNSDDSEYAFYMGPTTKQLSFTLGIVANCLKEAIKNLLVIKGKSNSRYSC